MGRILALDYGEKRIGLALSDPLRIFARPFKVLANGGFANILEELLSIINEQEIQLLIVGLPYAIEGGNTPKTDETQAFLDKLKKKLEIPVLGWDERYTTDEAIAELIKLGYDWRQRRAIPDAMAATLILKSYLEHQ